MTLSRRTALKLGLGAGALPLIGRSPLAAEESVHPVAPAGAGVVRARPLPLDAVRLTGGPLERAQQRDAAYLLELEPDRMLAYYRERAGLERKAEPYGGWDGGGRNLTGHIGGHYLSAVSLMYAATGDARFKERADYIVKELKEVQDAHGDGYLVALEGGRDCFDRLAKGEIESGSFDLNGQWSPWYTLHKTYAGLRDAYRHTGNETALAVETAFAAWAEKVLSGLDEAQLEMMMNTEFGGMNEIFVDLYADTGDERWLEMSYKFEHDAFVDPLERHHDNLPGKHGNTAIPKLIGNAERFVHTQRPADLVAADFFWDAVVNHHSFTSGGHGKDEYWGPRDRIGAYLDGRTAETCNVYNMLKLTRRLFSLSPQPHYADFHEQALFNHILASFDTDTGRMCYMVPVGMGVQHEYQDMLHSFTCCVGSGMESHALHGHGIYYEDGDRLWVNLYAPSTAEWSDAGAQLTMETDFPEGERAKLTLDLRAPREATLVLRRPYWAGDGFAVRVNGQRVQEPGVPAGAELRGSTQYDDPPGDVSTYVEVTRTWRAGDVVEVDLPKTVRVRPTADMPRRVSLTWGPLVLAGDLGPEVRRWPRPSEEEGEEASRSAAEVPVFVAAERPPVEWLVPVAGEPGTFRTDGVGKEPNASARALDVELQPFYRLHGRRYATYWDTFTPEEWTRQQAEYAAEAERMRLLEAATVAYLQPGERVFEDRFAYQGARDSNPTRILGRPARTGRSWFSYEVPVDAEHPMTLIVTYYSDDRRTLPASFRILVDGEAVGDVSQQQTEPPRFFDVEYPIPAAVVAGKARVTVRFEADAGSQVSAIFGVRMIRGDATR